MYNIITQPLDTLCAADEYVLSNVCTACLAGTTNAANDDAADSDTTCDGTVGVKDFVLV